MTLAELRVVDVQAMWDELTTEQQASIGTAALAWELARRVAEDDGSMADDTVRQRAADIAVAVGSDLADAVADAFPGITPRPP